MAARLMEVAKAKMNKIHKKTVKLNYKVKKKKLAPHPDFSAAFSVNEVKVAIDSMKSGKAADSNGIYMKFFKHRGPITQKWLAMFFSDILSSSHIPVLLKKAKVTAILKPGRQGTDVSNYRPVSLLSITYKLLEILVLNRIQPEIEKILPVEQAGFRKNRSCAEQVLALTTHIETGFQNSIKTSAVFINLTAAYDTVWRLKLILKLSKVIPCKKTVELIDNMLTNRRFQVVLKLNY